MKNDYNPFTLPWLSIVNYPVLAVSDTELVLVVDKIKQQYREYGPNSLSLVLEEGVRIDRARPALLLAVINATGEWQKEISGWQDFRDRVVKSLTSRGYKNFIG